MVGYLTRPKVFSFGSSENEIPQAARIKLYKDLNRDNPNVTR